MIQYLTKILKIYSSEEAESSTNGARKLGCPYAEDWN